MGSEAQYWDKFKDMQKYIPFLESMVNRLENKKNAADMPREAQLSKIKSLRALLLDTSKRMKLENLEKCEQVLVKLYSKVEKTDILPTSIKLKVPENAALSEPIQQTDAVVSDSVGSTPMVDLKTAESVLELKTLLPVSDVNISMPVSNQASLVPIVAQISPEPITSPSAALITSGSCSETISVPPSIDTNTASAQEPITTKLVESTALTESYTALLDKCRAKLMSVSKKPSIMSISVPALTHVEASQSETVTNNISPATVEQVTSFTPSFYMEKNYDDLSPDENTNASISDTDESKYLFQRRTQKQTSTDLNPSVSLKTPRNYTRVLRSPETSPWRRTESTLFQRRSPKRSPRRRRSRSSSPSMKDERNAFKEFYRQGSNSSSKSKTKEKVKSDALGNIDIKLRENKKKLNKLNSAILNTIMKCDEKDVDIEQLRKVRQQIVEELKRTSANEDISEYILKSYKKIKKKKKKKNDVEEGEIGSDDEVVEKIYGNLVIEMKKERELLDSKSEKDSILVVPEKDITGDKTKKDMPKIKISLIISDNVGGNKQNDNKETPSQAGTKSGINETTSDKNKETSTQAGLISSTNETVSNENVLKQNDTEKQEVKFQATQNIDNRLLKPGSNEDTSSNLDALKAILSNDSPTLGNKETNKDLRKQEETLILEQPRLVDESSIEKTVCTTGIISETDILQALDNEIKGENLSLTGLAAIPSIAKPKKNIIAETLLNQDGDKKRRISLEKYKEKVGPSLTLSQPNILSPSQNDEIQQQSLLSPSPANYEEHVKLISRALTAKEYERFHSIISTTINDNIADPETNLSLRLKQKKDPTSFLQDLETETGPKSPEVEYAFPEDLAAPVIIPSDPVSESSKNELSLVNQNISKSVSNPSGGQDVDMRISFPNQVNRVPQPTPFSPPHVGLASPNIGVTNKPLSIPQFRTLKSNLSSGNVRHSMSDVSDHTPVQVHPNIKPDNVVQHLPSEKFTKSVVPKPIAITNKFNVSFPVSANYKGKNPKPLLGFTNVLSPSTLVTASEPKQIWDQDVMRRRALSRATSVSRLIDQDVCQPGDIYQGPDGMAYRSCDQSTTAYNVDSRTSLYTSFETDDFGPKVQTDHINNRLARARSREPSAIPSLMNFNSCNMDYDNRSSFDYNRATNAGRSLFRNINDESPAFRERSVGRNVANCCSSFCNYDKDCLSQFPNDRNLQDCNDTFIRERSVGCFDMDCNYGRSASRDEFECDFRSGNSMEQYDYNATPKAAFVRGRSVGRSLDSRRRDGSISSFDPRRRDKSVGRTFDPRSRDKSVGRTRDKSVGRTFDPRSREKSLSRKFDSRNADLNSKSRDKSVGRSWDPKTKDKSIESSSVGRQDSNSKKNLDPRLRETNLDSKIDDPRVGRSIDCKSASENREFSNSRDPRRSRLEKFEEKSNLKESEQEKNSTSKESNQTRTEKDSDRAKITKYSSSNQSPDCRSPRKLSERVSNRDRAKNYRLDKKSDTRRDSYYSRDSKKKATGLIYTNDNLARGLLGQSCGVRNYKIPKIKRNSVDEDTKPVNADVMTEKTLTDKNVVDINTESTEVLVTSSIEEEQKGKIMGEVNKDVDNSDKDVDTLELSVYKSNLVHDEKLDSSGKATDKKTNILNSKYDPKVKDSTLELSVKKSNLVDDEILDASGKVIDKKTNIFDSKDHPKVKDCTLKDNAVSTKWTLEQRIKDNEKTQQDETSGRVDNDDTEKESFPIAVCMGPEDDEDIDADIALEVIKIESRLSSADSGSQHPGIGSSNADTISRTSVEFDINTSLTTSNADKEQMIGEEKKEVDDKPFQNIDTSPTKKIEPVALPSEDCISAQLNIPDSTLHVDNGQIIDKEQIVRNDQVDVVDLPDSTNESEQAGAVTKNEGVESADMTNNENESGRASVAGPSTENVETQSKKSNEKLSSSDHQAIDTLGSILSLLKDKTKIMQILSLLDDNNETEKIKKKLSKLAEIESDDEDSTKDAENKNTVKSEELVESEGALPATKQSVMKKKKTLKQITKVTAKKTITKVKKKIVKKPKPVVKRITRSKAKAIIPLTLSTESPGTGKKRRDELQKLQEDIRDMFISKGVLSLTGIRNCRIQKMTNVEEVPAPESPQVNKTKKQKNVTTKKMKAQLKVPVLPETQGSIPCVVIEKANIVPPLEEMKQSEFLKPVREVKVLLTEAKKVSKVDEEADPLTTSETPSIIKVKKKPGTKPKGLVKSITEEVLTENKTISKANVEVEKHTETQIGGENVEIDTATHNVITDKPLVSDAIFPTKIKPGPKSKKISTLKSLIDQNAEDRRDELKTMMDDLIGTTTITENVEETAESVKDNSFDSEDESLSSFVSNSSTDNARSKALTKKKKKKAWSFGIIKSKKKKLGNMKVSEEVKKIDETEEVVPNVSDSKIDHKYFTDELYCFSEKKINYACKACSYVGLNIVEHYKINHMDIEVPISRLSPTSAVDALKQSLSTDFESADIQERNLKHQCRFCNKTLMTSLDLFFNHIVKEHTGEYNSDTQKSTPTVIRAAIPPPEENSLLLGYICGRCNYTQLSLENLKAHVANRHNDEETEVYTINMCAIASEQDNEKRLTRRALRLRKQQPLSASVTPESLISPTNDNQLSTCMMAEASSQLDLEKDIPDSDRPSMDLPHPASDLVVENIKRERSEEWQENDAVPDEQAPSKRIATSCAFAMVSEHTEGSPEVCPADLIQPECIKKETNTDQQAHILIEDSNLEPSPEPIDTGFILEKTVNGSNRYRCAVTQCHFETLSCAAFRRHINAAHSKQIWSGYCSLCKSYPPSAEPRQLVLVDALNHFVRDHNSEDIQQTLTAGCPTSDAQASPIVKPVSQSSTSATTEATSTPGSKQRPYISVKPLSHLVSQPVLEQPPNLCNLLDTSQPDEPGEPSFLQLRIENVVSLKTAESKKSPVPDKTKDVQSSSPTDKREPGNVLIHYSPNINSANIKPGTVVISKASSASKALNEDRSSKLAVLSRDSPKSPANSATTSSAISEPSTSLLHNKEKDSISKLISIIAQSKQPLVLQRMLINAKILHLFKCGDFYCSYTTSSAYAFTAHLAEHRKKRAVSCVGTTGETRCVYCSYENVSVMDLVRHVLEEHGHCTHSCAYCWYTATAGSLVELHRTKTHHQNRQMVLKLKPVTSHSHRESMKMMRPRNEVILPYFCKQTNLCKYKCYTSAVFISHLELHRGDSSFKCPYCPGTFVRIVYLMRHLREHGLCLYQCPYCLHGADTEIEMLNHMAEYHPNRRTVAHLRYVIEKVSEDTELSKYKTLPLVNLDKTEVEVLDNTENTLEEDPIKEVENSNRLRAVFQPEPCAESSTKETADPKSSQTEDTAKDLPPESTETVESGEMAILSVSSGAKETTKKSESNAVLIKVEEGQKNVEGDKETAVPLESEKPAQDDIICLDSDDDDVVISNLRIEDTKKSTDSASETKEKRMTRLSSERGKDKIKLNDEVITLMDDEENVQGATTAAAAQAPLQCARCSLSIKRVHNFKTHITKCYVKHKSSIRCKQCQASATDADDLIAHIVKVHRGGKLFLCDLCSYQGWELKLVIAHMWQVHKVQAIDLDRVEVGTNEKDTNVIVKLKEVSHRPGPKRKMSVSKVPAEAKKISFGPQDIDELPLNPILDEIIYCSKCKFGTKVRSNMLRHLQLHASEIAVPSVAPVNPVPHLETNEKHFDKMANLALSSNMGRMGGDKSTSKEKQETRKVIDASFYPKYMLDNERYVCGALGCQYISLNEMTLKHHWEALHPGVTSYKCVHCPSNQQLDTSRPLTAARIVAHLKMHDMKLYACSECKYYHHQKHLVERHLIDKHGNVPKASVCVIREAEEDVLHEKIAPVEKSPQKAQPTMDLKPWKCNICKYKTLLRSDIIMHCHQKHGLKMQFKCSFCSFMNSNSHNVTRHMQMYHEGKSGKTVIKVYDKDDGTGNDDASDAPNWWNQNKRPCIFTEDGSSDSGNQSGPQSKKMKVDQNNPSDEVDKESNVVNRVLGITQGLSQDYTEQNAVDLNIVKTEEGTEGFNSPRSFGEYGEPKGTSFLCPLCTSHTTSDVVDMKTHLYEELNYRKWCCPVCAYKAFDMPRFQQHSMIEHTQYHAPKELPADAAIEKWVDSVIAHQLAIIEKSKETDPKQPAKKLPSIAPGSLTQTNLSEINDEPSNTSMEEEYILSDSAPNLLLSETLKVNSPQGSIANDDPNQRLSIANLEKQYGPFGAPQGQTYTCPKCEYRTHVAKDMEEHLLTKFEAPFWSCSICHATHPTYPEAQRHNSEQHKNAGSSRRKAPVKQHVEQWISSMLQVQKLTMNYMPSLAHNKTSSDAEPSTVDELLVIRKESKPKVIKTPVKNVAARKRKLSEDSDDSMDRLVIFEPSKQDLAPTKIPTTPTKEKPLNQCPHCEFSTKYKTSLVNHIPQHFNMKPFKCSYCDFHNYKKYVRAHVLKDHPGKAVTTIQNVMPDVLPGAVHHKRGRLDVINPKKELICLVCNTSMSALQSPLHHESSHPGQEMQLVRRGDIVFFCKECFTYQKTSKLMMEHFEKVHPTIKVNYSVQKYKQVKNVVNVCLLCNMNFAYMWDLKCHHEHAHRSMKLTYVTKNISSLSDEKLAAVKESNAASDDEIVEVMSDAEKNETQSELSRSSTEPESSIIKKLTARKSTTKLPMSLKMVARKSTTKLPYQHLTEVSHMYESYKEPDEFSYYGNKPDMNVGHIMTRMPFYGTMMEVTVKKLSELIRIYPVVQCEKMKEA